MSRLGSDGATAVAEALAEIDLDALRVDESRIDLDALAALRAPLARVRTELASLADGATESRSVWLVDKARRQLDDFDESVADHLPSLDIALDAVELAPVMLGVDGPRTYLLIVTYPVESRGLGGCVDHVAELVVDDGVFSLGPMESATDLDARVAAADALVRGVDGFGTACGSRGDGAGLDGDGAFGSLATSQDFPWLGAIAADLYEQTTGRVVDGVIAADALAVASLLRYTGPILLDGDDVELNIDNAVDYLVRDQYADGESEPGGDALGEVATIVFQRLIDGDLPNPIAFSHEIGPLVADRRVLLWSAHLFEQQLLDRVSASGSTAELGGGAVEVDDVVTWVEPIAMPQEALTSSSTSRSDRVTDRTDAGGRRRWLRSRRRRGRRNGRPTVPGGVSGSRR